MTRAAVREAYSRARASYRAHRLLGVRWRTAIRWAWCTFWWRIS